MKNIVDKSLVLLLSGVAIFFLTPISLMADKPDTVVKPPKPTKPSKPPQVDVISPLKTGQTISYDSDGNKVNGKALKDDGYYEKGIKPDFSRDDVMEIVINNLTGLMWQDDTYIAKQWLTDSNYVTCDNDNTSPACYDTSGDTAASYCTNLTLGGFSDWRLPSRSELANIVDYGSSMPAIDSEIFKLMVNGAYWTSTTAVNYADYVEGNNKNAWSVHFYEGTIPTYPKRFSLHVRCVRDGQ